MTYLAYLPSLICGIAVSVEDIRRRRVPRLWIAIGCLTQLVAVIIVAVMANTMFLLVQAPLFAVLSAVLQAGLAMAKPGSMGFGDVTCTLAMGLAVGMAGLTAVVVWWLAMGLLGLAWMALWLRFDPLRRSDHAGKVPFAPAIVCAAVVAVIATTLL